MPKFQGGCHCGAVTVTFESAHDAQELEVRACGCSFCRSHGARTMTDPGGNAAITAKPDALNRYRFGLGTADFLVCNNCGTYVGAYFDDAGQGFATLNVNAFQARADFSEAAKSADYDAETAESRMARRRTRWTPAALNDRDRPSSD